MTIDKNKDTITNVRGYLDYFCNRYANNIFMKVKKGDAKEPRTYAQFHDDCFRLATAMIDMELTDKHVAMFAENRYEYVVCMFASMLAGAPYMPVYITMPEQTIAGMVAFADIQVAFVSDACKPMVEAIAQMGVKIPTVISLDGDGEGSYAELIRKGNPDGREFYGDMEDDRTALMCFTSGTSSGKPKCVMLTCKNMLVSSCHKIHDTVESVPYECQHFAPLPLFHLANLACFIIDYTITRGSIYATSDSVKDCFRDILEYRPMMGQVVPAIAKTFITMMEGEVERRGETETFAAYCKECDEGKYSFEDRREITKEYRKVVGGELHALSVIGAQSEPDVIQKLAYFGILTGCDYGLTECSPCVTIDQAVAKRVGSVGKMLPYMEAKIVDGELYVKGDHVMKGYYKNPEGTADILSADGWLRTGDLAEIDADGYVFIRGRASSVVVLSNGDNIDVEELEMNVLAACSAVEEIILLADKKNNNDTLGALIYAKPGCDRADVEEQINAFNKGLSPQKRIVRYRLMDKPFERNEMMKIKRFLYRDEII